MTPFHDVNAPRNTPPPVARPRPGAHGRPGRSGQPWVDEDYERLVVLVREGHDVPQIAEALERTEGAVAPRLRAMLPPEQRGILADRVLRTLRGHVQEQPDYPWAEIMVQLPPPTPVVQRVVHRAGAAGLEAALLVEVAWALLHCETADAGALREVCDEVVDRGLDEELTARLVDALLCRIPPATPDEARYAAMARLDRARGLTSSRSRYDQHPWEHGW